MTSDSQSRQCSIYKCFNADGEIIYIGMAYDVGSMIMQHRGNLWFDQVNEVKAEPVKDRYEARKLEKSLIKLHKPKYNYAMAYDGNYSDYFTRIKMSEEMRQRIERWRFAQFEETGKTPSFSEACRLLIDLGLKDE